ncbi:30S ribosomal protein S9 [Candidatus Saccharibacteria bacterium]|nr:30S ribosomal protein S9 [Candidatus Saccharibacteria bacterium]MBI3338169.1 30S ribosomal protein S9 [Candidatus Saccharibacteria bacterium]
MATTSKQNYFYALGRRKSATARVRLTSGKGDIVINGKPAENYLENSKYLLNALQRPFTVLEIENKFNVSAKVSGGGSSGQVDAIRLGIAKALALMNEDLRSTLRRADQLSRNPREKERKKFGLKGARKQRQFTKR